MYDKEEQDTIDPGSVSPLVMNRTISNCKYGIWGHYLGELYIERIYHNSKIKTLTMFIGS